MFPRLRGNWQWTGLSIAQAGLHRRTFPNSTQLSCRGARAPYSKGGPSSAAWGEQRIQKHVPAKPAEPSGGCVGYACGAAPAPPSASCPHPCNQQGSASGGKGIRQIQRFAVAARTKMQTGCRQTKAQTAYRNLKKGQGLHACSRCIAAVKACVWCMHIKTPSTSAFHILGPLDHARGAVLPLSPSSP